MKITMVVPTYISRKSTDDWKEGDAVYDHATALDQEGTLVRLLESIKILKNKHFELVLIVSTTTPEINKEALKKVIKDVKKVNNAVPIYLFTEDNLNKIKSYFPDDINTDILNIQGYPNVRNLCLYIPYIMGSDVSILIDDDEIFEDPYFVDKSIEFIGKRFHGKTIDGVAGYYLNEDNNYYDKVTKQPWMTYWDRFGSKAEAFDLIIGKKPRLKETPFAFGGAMVLHRNLFKVVPFDPKITRGEDIDYLINTKIFGFNFFLDNELSIKHKPPKKTHAVWKRFREDIYRLLYEKAKIDDQYDVPNLNKVTAEDFLPYPGHFLDDSLEDKIFKTNMILGLEYLTNNDMKSAKACIESIYLAKNTAKPNFDVFEHLLKIQKQWRKILIFSKKKILKKIISVINKNRFEFLNKEKQLKITNINISLENKIKLLEKIELFSDIPMKYLRLIAEMAHLENYPKDNIIFNKGEVTKGLYIIVKGQISLLKKENDQELQVSVIKKNEPLGEISLISKGNHTIKSIAKVSSDILLLARKDFEKLLEENNDFAKQIYKNIAIVIGDRLKETSKELAKLKTQDTDVSIKIKQFN